MANNKASVGDTVYVNRHTHGVKLGEGRVSRVLPGDEIDVIVRDHRGEFELKNVPWTKSESGDGWLTRADGAKYLAAQQPAEIVRNAPPSEHPSGYRDAPMGSDPLTTPQSLPQVQQNAVRPVAGMTGSTSADESRSASTGDISRDGERTNADDRSSIDSKFDGAKSDAQLPADNARNTATAGADANAVAAKQRSDADAAAKAKAEADLAKAKNQR